MFEVGVAFMRRQIINDLFKNYKKTICISMFTGGNITLSLWFFYIEQWSFKFIIGMFLIIISSLLLLKTLWDFCQTYIKLRYDILGVID